MSKRITIIQGHPDPQGDHYCHGLAQAYAESAIAAGHQVRLIPVARLDFPMLRTARQFTAQPPPEAMVGSIESPNPKARERALSAARALGATAS